MKYIGIIFIILLMACQSPADKAHKLIKEELFKNLHDFSSYEPVEFGKLDSVYTTIAFTDAHELLKWGNVLADSAQKLIKAAQVFEKSRKEYPFCDSMYLITSRLADSLLTIARENIEHSDSISRNFKPQFCGFRMSHRFRAKNAQGNILLSENEYFFDKKITMILKIQKN